MHPHSRSSHASPASSASSASHRPASRVSKRIHSASEHPLWKRMIAAGITTGALIVMISVVLSSNGQAAANVKANKPPVSVTAPTKPTAPASRATLAAPAPAPAPADAARQSAVVALEPGSPSSVSVAAAEAQARPESASVSSVAAKPAGESAVESITPAPKAESEAPVRGKRQVAFAGY